MVARMAMPGGEQRRPGAGDDGIVFGVDADQRPASAGQLHHPQNFRITKLDVVGGEDLQRPVPGGHQRSEVGLKARDRQVGQGEVEGVVDHGAPFGAGGVVRQCVGQGLPGSLSGEGDDAGGPTHGCGPGGGLEGIGVPLAHARHLLDMGVDIDPAGHDHATSSLDHPARSGHRRADRRDAAAIDAQIALDNALGRDDLRLSDHKIDLLAHPVCSLRCHDRMPRTMPAEPARAKPSLASRRCQPGAARFGAFAL